MNCEKSECKSESKSEKKSLITIEDCCIRGNSKNILEHISWRMKNGEAWLVTGSNGSGKAEFLKALAGKIQFEPHELSKEDIANGKATPLYSSVFTGCTAIVSLEEAAHLIEEERERDESEIMDKEDEGRTARAYLCEVLGGSDKKNAELPPIASRLETLPQVKLCGVEKILDRGLRYLSTGEIRRTLLCRALLSGCSLLILSDPFAGLDAGSRKILLDFFNTVAGRQLKSDACDLSFPRIILCMERFHEIPDAINRVLEFDSKKISFCGERTDYEKMFYERRKIMEEKQKALRDEFLTELSRIRKESALLTDGTGTSGAPEMLSEPTSISEPTDTPASLIRFENVNVGWGDHHVLVNLNWEVFRGEHWLLRGPNGSGKTTILELITGDNMQVFREKIFLFGKKRGTGETIWDIKKQLGIVSYRLHVEYRMVGGTSLEDVIISGFHDSIGLYEVPTDFEKSTAREWLKLAGFKGREQESFGSLSYGEQRAILIIRAAVKSPRVLILDEPCHGLDEEYRAKILDLLETVAETGTTTLLHVTHDPSEVLNCEKHILELHPGEDPMYSTICEKTE